MAKILRKHIVPIYARKEYGIECRHVKISKIGLWFRWLYWGIAPLGEDMSWKRTKQLAKEGNLVVKKHFVLCPGPLWSTFYYIL